jgi:hypothetical protein
MYLNYFNNFKRRGGFLFTHGTQAVAAVLIVMMVTLGSPAGFAFAEESETTTEEASSDTSSNTNTGTENDTATDHGDDGSDGEGAGGSEGEGDDTTIETGDAVAEGTIENEANTNSVDTDSDEGDISTNENQVEGVDEETAEANDDEEAASTDETEEKEIVLDENASSTPENIEEEESGAEQETESSADETSPSTASGNNASTTAETSIDIASESEAEIENVLDVGAETGENTATSTSGTTTIETGDALSSANIVNVVNTNIVNSNGFLLLLNQLFGAGAFDLRDFDFGWNTGTPASEGAGNASTSPCSLEACDGEVDLNVTSTSTAVIKNDVVARSSTGGNTASGAGAHILTGDAYAGVNVVNVANTNIIDSNYLLVSLNNFGDYADDIVFPGLSFFNQFFTQSGLGGGSLAATSSNTADIENNVSTVAQTGDNTASSTNGSSVVTGDANSGSSVVNTVNTNLLGGNSVFILLNVYGDWSGDIFGLPPGISWTETPEGVVLFSENDASLGTEAEPSGDIAIGNNSSTTIKNNIEVYALTGDNKVNATNGDGVVVTGDAHASANIINIANTNAIGQNWILAMFNIFGNWDGNFAFGRPDLWVGVRAESPDNPIGPESSVTYHYTVTNFGDSNATDVVLDNAFNRDLLIFSGLGESGNGGRVEVGTLAPGESKEISYTAHVSNNLGGGQTPIEMTTTATSRETDNNTDDNSDSVAIIAVRPTASVATNRTNGLPYADLRITKTANVATTTIPGFVDYTITVNNYGSSAYEATLYDTLEDEDGGVISSQEWPLGEIFPDEEITVTYTVEFGEDARPGLYANNAMVKAMDVRSLNQGGNSNSDVAETDVILIAEKLVEEKQECSPYLTTYIRSGALNDPEEVRKLQTFLNDYERHHLTVTGQYDRATESAVRAFQEKHRADVLDPWEIETPTGYVYYTTQKHINELYCGSTFPLSSEQLAEIDAFKTRQDALEAQGEPIDTSNVGLDDTEPHFAREEESVALSVASSVDSIIAGAGAAGESSGVIAMLKSTFDKIKVWISQITFAAEPDY